MGDIYNKYYGFKEAPFNITPDPKFLFFSDKHREALNHLLFGIRQRKGFIQLTGEVGAGKTTLCRALLQKLGDNYKTALILNPCLSQNELIRAILTEFGLNPAKENRVAYLDTLNKFLLEEVHAGNDVVLIIDEAQDLSIDMLEQVRLLSNLETNERKLLQIILMGQPELRDKLNDDRLRQLRQRITVRYHLPALTREELQSYIQHRIHTGGGNGRPNFNRGAIRKIHRYSRGIPRLINAVCDKTLLCGFVEGTELFGSRHVRRAIRELEGNFK